jgi:hypothetical protein
VERLDSPCQLAHAKAGTFSQLGKRFVLISHSLCYASPPAQAALLPREAPWYLS